MSKQETKEAPQPEPVRLSDEQLSLHRWRYREARRHGFTWREAKLFASSKIDLEQMRRLSRAGWSADQIFYVLL